MKLNLTPVARSNWNLILYTWLILYWSTNDIGRAIWQSLVVAGWIWFVDKIQGWSVKPDVTQ